jgi:DNA-binding transcriptional MerR regulator
MTQARAKSVSKRGKPSAATTATATTQERPLKIGEAARAVGVEAYVLRFWETQFPILRPRHSRSRHRFYEPEDLKTLKLIKRLLHNEGFTIAGAKKHIREVGLDRLMRGAAPARSVAATPDGDTVTTHHDDTAIRNAPPLPLQRTLVEIRNDLMSLHKLLAD